jgi:hypothetical protein
MGMLIPFLIFFKNIHFRPYEHFLPLPGPQSPFSPKQSESMPSIVHTGDPDVAVIGNQH